MYCAALNNVPDSIEKWQLARTLRGGLGIIFPPHEPNSFIFFQGMNKLNAVKESQDLFLD